MNMQNVIVAATAVACAVCVFTPAVDARPPQARGGGIAGVGPQCPVSCANPGGPPFIPEGEPCGVNTINCGCDCTQDTYLQLRCPEGYCGEVWAFNGQHDTDWYNVHVNDIGGTGFEQICFTLNADFPAVIELYTGNCGSLTMVAQGQANDCNPTTICACLPAPQFAKLKIYPGTISGGPINTGMPCPNSNKYTLRFNCSGTCDLGACCYQVPPICGIMTQQQCAQLPSSTWYGVGSQCGTGANPCPTLPTGACCYTNTAGVPDCIQTDQQNCHQLLGIYLGDNVPCPPPGAPCAPPTPTGACCYVDANGVTNCIQTTQQDCTQTYSGTYLGDNSPCPPAGTPCAPTPTGACCYTDTTGVPNCIQTTQQDCTQTYSGTYLGDNSPCPPAGTPCIPTGACCYSVPGTPGFQCTITTQALCIAAFNGTYLGNGTSCNPDPCNTGACCYVDPVGYHCIQATLQDCHNIYQGVFQGPGTTCTPGLCDPTGACCYQGAAGPTCQIMTQQQCAGLPGSFWLGVNSVCPPPTVPCFQPDGACCFKDGPNAFYICIITTQTNCANYPQSTWMGAGTSCTPDPCPVTGACCFQPAGAAVTCIITTQSDCVNNLNGSYLGDGVPCTADSCNCVTPPWGMVAWWTLDDIAGGVANDTVAGHHGAYQPSSSTGPNPAPGMVAGGLSFDGVDDYVQVPHSPMLDFNCGPFSIDAWVYPLSLGGVIVSKETSFPIGYNFSVDAGGNLTLVMTTSSLRCIAQSTTTIAANVWSHVAVTVSGGGSQRIVTFYVNGAPAGTSTIGCVCVGNSAPLLIGNSPLGGLWTGTLDEIEIFRRELAAWEVQAIYGAGSKGKCKHRCHLPWDHPFCLNQNQVTVTFTVCNDSAAPHPYNINFQQLPVGPGCSIPGPTVFTPLFSNPVNIPANTCVNLQVTINRPTGMNAVNLVGCYQVNVTNLDNGQTSFCQGSVQDRRDLCAVIVNCCIGVEFIPVGVASAIRVDVTNTTDGPVSVPLLIEAMDSMTMEPSETLSLNGLPPGEPVKDTLVIGDPNETVSIEVTARYVQHHALGFDDVVFSTGEAGVASGGLVPLISVGLASDPPLTCPADLAPPGPPMGDGQVNVDDLLVLLAAWGNTSGPADINGDGLVNVDDLLILLASWGPC